MRFFIHFFILAFFFLNVICTCKIEPLVSIPFLRAMKEEKERRNDTYGYQIPALLQLTRQKVKAAHYTQENITKLQGIVKTIINRDISMIQKLNNYIGNNSNDFSIPLQTNKNILTFQGALQLCEDEFSNVTLNKINSTYILDPSIPNVIGGSNGDSKGTSIANFLQVLALSVLRGLNLISSIIDVSQLAEQDLYNVGTSSVIQTVNFPLNFNSSFIGNDFSSWFYFYNGSYSDKQGALLIPNLGYQYGGSRDDPQYNQKKFKSEDCSSSISKWTRSPNIFSTSDMEIAYDSVCQTDPNIFCPITDLCNDVLKVLRPICNGKLSLNVTSGDVFAVRHPSGGGHTGFVSFANQDCFYALSYERSMPQKEGLGYDWYCPTKDDYWFYFSHRRELEI